MNKYNKKILIIETQFLTRHIYIHVYVDLYAHYKLHIFGQNVESLMINNIYLCIYTNVHNCMFGLTQ